MERKRRHDETQTPPSPVEEKKRIKSVHQKVSKGGAKVFREYMTKGQQMGQGLEVSGAWKTAPNANGCFFYRNLSGKLSKLDSIHCYRLAWLHKYTQLMRPDLLEANCAESGDELCKYMKEVPVTRHNCEGLKEEVGSKGKPKQNNVCCNIDHIVQAVSGNGNARQLNETDKHFHYFLHTGTDEQKRRAEDLFREGGALADRYNEHFGHYYRDVNM